MFTGMVKGKGSVERVDRKDGLLMMSIAMPERLREGLEIGASVSVDGVCLTVTSLAEHGVEFDVILESLSRTTLGNLEVDDRVNLERSAMEGAEVGGGTFSRVTSTVPRRSFQSHGL